MDNLKEFERKKRRVQEFAMKISELKGELKAAEQAAKERFDTTDIEELKKIKNKLENKIGNLETKIEDLNTELDKRLKKIEEWEDDSDPE